MRFAVFRRNLIDFVDKDDAVLFDPFFRFGCDFIAVDHRVEHFSAYDFPRFVDRHGSPLRFVSARKHTGDALHAVFEIFHIAAGDYFHARHLKLRMHRKFHFSLFELSFAQHRAELFPRRAFFLPAFTLRFRIGCPTPFRYRIV